MSPARASLLLLSLALSAACGRRADALPAAEPAAPAAGPALVEPARVRHAGEVLATGLLRSRQTAQLAPSVPGTLQRVVARRGQQVVEGATLLILDGDAARATLAQAEAAVSAAEAQLRLAEDALRRTAEIQKADGGVAPAQLVQVEAQRDLAAAQAAAARAQRQQAEVNLRYHTLRAPFPGVVTRVPEGVGMPVAPGAPLVSLESTRTLVLDTSLTQEEAAAVAPGAAVEVWVPATGARTREARVAVVVPAVDPATGRVPVEIEISNAAGRFLPHASARARLPAGPPRDLYRVPTGALLQRDGAHAVWTAGADGKARALPARLVAQEGDSALVDPGPGGWPAGLRVVERPPLGIAEGVAVAEAGR
ncbi:MAG: efflux RND transporter periplasmic adaptor subunit [Deltaproteobacteria bacterium]|nr:efflux RND transporter periplasmic adaptor subunit [Deltaproteobacteria bacterium]